MNKFKSYASAEPTGFGDGVDKLPAGRQDVTIKQVYYTTDHYKTLKTAEKKATLPAWSDETDQLAIVFQNKNGVDVRRFNGAGFVRFDEMSEKERKGFIRLGDDGYAVNDQTKERLEDEERTAKCMRIVDQFFDACGLPVGSDPEKLLGRQVSVEVTHKTYKDKPVSEIGGFQKIGTQNVHDLTEDVTEPKAEDLATDY